VWEWCNDWAESYTSGSRTDPTGPSPGTFCILRGGAWDNAGSELRSPDRATYTPDYRNEELGFRCVRR